jgi:hypothetical protein
MEDRGPKNSKEGDIAITVQYVHLQKNTLNAEGEFKQRKLGNSCKKIFKQNKCGVNL